MGVEISHWRLLVTVPQFDFVSIHRALLSAQFFVLVT